MNILVLFSYGSLHTIDDVPYFYQDIYHGTATNENIEAGIKNYESIGMPDPLGSNTYRIGRELSKRLAADTNEEWKFLIANHHAIPSIETVAIQCAEMTPKRVVTLGLTPFDSITGLQAYEKKFIKHFRAKNDTTKLIHIPPYCDNESFVEVLADRAQTARAWLPEKEHEEVEIVFTIHSLPGLPEAHKKMINQYEQLAKNIATLLNIKTYHIAYRSGNPEQRWLEPDVLDVVSSLGQRDVKAVIFIEVLSVIENLEVLQEITGDAIYQAKELGMKAVQSEYLNDSVDFIEVLESHIKEYV